MRSSSTWGDRVGAQYELLNFTRSERIPLAFLGGSKAREIIWSHPAAALVVWYMLRYRGDQIALVSDYDPEEGRTFFGRAVSHDLIASFKDVQEEPIAHAIAARVLIDDGWRQICESDPDPEMRLRSLRIDNRNGPLPPEHL